MAKFKKSDFNDMRNRLSSLPEDRQKTIKEGAAAILKDIRLAEVRKALDVTQASLSVKTGMKQADVSRIENNIENVQIRTLDRYVTGLGGICKIVAEFPDGTVAEIPLKSGKPVKSRVSIEKQVA